jgi:hypothetical protein
MKYFVVAVSFFLMMYDQAMQFNRLAHSLHQLGVKKGKKLEEKEDVFGSWLLKKHPKKVLDYNENFDNKGIKIYQLAVMQQTGEDCGVHAFRNILFHMDMLLSSRTQFDSIYAEMLSAQQYNNFLKEVGCSRKGMDETGLLRMYAKIQESLIQCIRTGCIPQKSAAYVENIMIFEHLKRFDNDLWATMKRQIESIEFSKNAEQVSFDALILMDNAEAASEATQKPEVFYNYLKRFKKFVTDLHHNKKYVFGVEILSTTIEHGLAFIVHKVGNTIEYFFADSNNCLFTRPASIECENDDKSFRASVRTFIRLISNPSYFDDCLVRLLYNDLINNQIDKKTFYRQMQNLSLTNNKLYLSVYKGLI